MPKTQLPPLFAPHADDAARTVEFGASSSGLGWLERLIALTAHIRARPTAQGALAVMTFGVALATRFVSDPYLPPGFPYLTFFPAVIVSGVFGGVASGVLCAVLSGLAAWYWFMPPFESFAVTGGTLVALAFYVFVVSVDLLLIHLVTLAVLQMNRRRAQADRLLERQRTLFSELQHRVANNLAFVSALFGIQKRKLIDNPEAVAAFDDARMRLDTMGRLHRRLYDPANTDQPLDRFLRDLLNDMFEGAAISNVRLDIVADPIELPLESKMMLALVVAEVVTNSLKHAFKGRDGGMIVIRLTRDGEDKARLMVRDDGPGWPDGGPAPASKSLGMRIIKSFATHLHGELSHENDGGAATMIVFPIPREG